MAEWLKAHAWKACLGETLTRVRIPVSPPYCIIRKDPAGGREFKRNPMDWFSFQRARLS
jgi:hypothetical protein